MNNLAEIFTTNSASIGVIFIMLASSFIGGVIASISPCLLAMLPLIIGYVGGYSKETPARTLIQLFSFILGTAIVFSIIGIICVITGSVFASALGPYFTLIIASILMVMGLKIMGFLDFEIPVIIKSMPQNNTSSLIVYPLLLGVTFALAGTPCSTPILAGIMAFAAMSKNFVAAILMLFLFALGQGLILIIAGMFTSSVKNIKKFSKYTEMLLSFSGFLLLLVAIYLYYKVFSPLF